MPIAGITIAEKIEPSYVSFELAYEDAQLLKRISEKLGTVDAIRVLRIIIPKCGLKQAKDFIDSL